MYYLTSREWSQGQRALIALYFAGKVNVRAILSCRLCNYFPNPNPTPIEALCRQFKSRNLISVSNYNSKKFYIRLNFPKNNLIISVGHKKCVDKKVGT